VLHLRRVGVAGITVRGGSSGSHYRSILLMLPSPSSGDSAICAPGSATSLAPDLHAGRFSGSRAIPSGAGASQRPAGPSPGRSGGHRSTDRREGDVRGDVATASGWSVLGLSRLVSITRFVGESVPSRHLCNGRSRLLLPSRHVTRWSIRGELACGWLCHESAASPSADPRSCRTGPHRGGFDRSCTGHWVRGGSFHKSN
jgi:hypothetical protein